MKEKADSGICILIYQFNAANQLLIALTDFSAVI